MGAGGQIVTTLQSSRTPSAPLDLADPSAWDTALVQRPSHELAAITKSRTNLHTIRRFQAAFADANDREIERMVERLRTIPSTLAIGVRMLFLTYLERLDEVFALEPYCLADSNLPNELEGACYANFSVAMAASMKGDQSRAFGMLHAALAYATSARMYSRAQHIALDLERVRNVLGQGSPARIREIASMFPLTPRREQWMRDLMAGAFLGRGEYVDVLANTAEDSAVRRFTQAMLNIGEAKFIESENQYDSLTNAVWALRGRIPWDVTEEEFSQMRGEQPVGYARLFRGLRVIQNGENHAALQGLIGPYPPPIPDQRLLWVTLCWEALAHNVEVTSPGVLVQALQRCQDDLVYPLDAAKFIRDLLPTTFVALALSPVRIKAFDELLREVPMIVGEHLQNGDQLYKLPGRTNGGQALVRAALGESRQTSKVERFRVRQELRNLGITQEPVNIGDVVMRLQLLREGRRGEAKARWDGAVRQVVGMMTGRGLIQAAEVRFGL